MGFLFLFIIFFIDIATRVSNNCTEWIGVLIGLVIGTIYGISWFTLWWVSGNKKLLYYDELTSNNVKCVKTKQKFICKKSMKTPLPPPPPS